jgi:hypothetical protein
MNDLSEITSLSFDKIRKLEFSLAVDLNRLQRFAERLSLEELINQIADTIRHIESHSFTVAVVGEFKRGKSTFINALLGREILPADIAPTSATLNRVTYGSPPQVKIIYKSNSRHGARVEEITIDELAAYVTKLTPEAEAVATQVEEAVVYYPVRYCENNVQIYDTPGLNDDESMTAVTLSVLSRVDAAIMVILANAPFSRFEGDFLNKLLMNNQIGQVLFVVTAIDRLRHQTERERVLQLVTDRIKMAARQYAAERFGADTPDYHQYLQQLGEPRIYGLSGYDALEAKINGDLDKLAQSGFQHFEKALEKFLAEERRAVGLRVIAERTITYGEKIFKTLDLQRGALQMKQQEFDVLQESTLAELNRIRRRSEVETARLEKRAVKIKAQVSQAIRAMTEAMNEAAATIIDTTEISGVDLNRASVGALGAYVSELVIKVPEDLQEKSKRGWGRLLSKVPASIQEAGRDALKKMAEKVPESVQNVNKAPAIEGMAQQISKALQRISQSSTEKIQLEIQQELDMAVEAARAFARAADDVLQHTEAQFMYGVPESVSGRSSSTESLSAALTVITELGEIWSGYHVAGLKSAASGNMTGLGTLVNSGWQNIKAKLSGEQSPESLPAGVDRITAFKASYKASAAAEVKRQIEMHNVTGEIDSQVTAALEGLKRKMTQEVEQAITKMQNKLVQLQEKRDRSAILTERDQEDLATMCTEVQQILEKAYKLSEQLVTGLA